MDLGYKKNLYILAFDHRTTIAQKMFGVSEVAGLNSEQKFKIKQFKEVIYEGFKKALNYVPKENAAILIEEEFGEKIIEDAKKKKIITILTLEKSGIEKLEFIDPTFANLERIQPQFGKILIKYNPQDAVDSKKQKQEKLKKVSEFCHQKGFNFLLEVLVLPQFETSSREDFDELLRPKLTAQMIEELQDAGVEPDVWKLEGMDKIEDYKEIIKVAKSNGRENVGIVILGRGESEEKVEEWISLGAKVEGVLGFAVGRTIFWDSLVSLENGVMSKQEAVEKIQMRFEDLYKIFANAKAS